MANTIIKNKTAKIPTKSGKEYSYTYTDLASINKWLDENGLDYYQTIETNSINGKDYIMTYRYINGEWEDTPKKGCQVVDSILQGVSNPVQQYGSSLSYVRRYSLCMAFGLAMEDDDGNSAKKEEPLEITIEEAENYTFKSGKHEGWTLKEVIEEDEGFLNWLLENGDEKILAMIKLLTNKEPKTEEQWDEKLDITKRFQRALVDSGYDLDELVKHYGVAKYEAMTNEQLEDAIKKMNIIIERNKKK